MTDQTTWPMPQVNMNGTSRQSLVDSYGTAFRAVAAAIDAVANAAPHGRDYQTLDAGAWKRANAAHVARCVALNQIWNDLESILLHLQS